MQMIDTDRLSTTADLRTALLRLTTILREAEALPAEARLRFWENLDIPVEDVRISADVSLLSINALYNILVAMCGPQFTELVVGQTKGMIEGAFAQLKDVQSQQSQRSDDWDAFLDVLFAATQGTDHEGCLQARVILFTVGDLGEGVLKRAEGAAPFLVLRDTYDRERYFASKDIIALEFKKT